MEFCGLFFFFLFFFSFLIIDDFHHKNLLAFHSFIHSFLICTLNEGNDLDEPLMLLILLVLQKSLWFTSSLSYVKYLNLPLQGL